MIDETDDEEYPPRVGGGRGGLMLEAAQILGTDVALKSIVGFIDKYAESLEAQAPFELVVGQATARMGEGHSIHAVMFDGEREPIDVAEELLDHAVADMERGGYVTRVTFYVRVQGEKERIQFTLTRPQRTREERYNPQFAPGIEGAHALTMQQNQFLIDKVVDMAEKATVVLEKELDQVRAENRGLKRLEWDMRKNAVDLLYDMKERQLRDEERQREQDRKDMMVKGATMLAPALIAGLFGPQAAQMLVQVQQATAVAGALGSGGGGGDGGGEGGGGAASPSETEAAVDQLIATLRSNPVVLQELFKIGEKAPALQEPLGKLFEGAMKRQEARERFEKAQAAQAEAQAVAAEAASTMHVPPPPGSGNGGTPPGYYGAR